ncbi:hypothetical protein B7Y94_01585 [Candidatus Saccharibacteria bacterium 32-49-12]|nr:MAG: hypothetical protein B7Y94_01585 [Candidatus Saccharibacteria bacterium 32-49-12]
MERESRPRFTRRSARPAKKLPKDRLIDLPLKLVVWIVLGIPMAAVMVVSVGFLSIRNIKHRRQDRLNKSREGTGAE